MVARREPAKQEKGKFTLLGEFKKAEPPSSPPEAKVEEKGVFGGFAKNKANIGLLSDLPTVIPKSQSGERKKEEVKKLNEPQKEAKIPDSQKTPVEANKDTKNLAEAIKNANALVEAIKDTTQLVEGIKDTKTIVEAIQNTTPLVEAIKDTETLEEAIKGTKTIVEAIKKANPAAEAIKETKTGEGKRPEEKKDGKKEH